MSRFVTDHYLTVADFVATFSDATAHSWALGDPWPRRVPGVSFSPMMESFGERLRRLRLEQGYTVVDLAAAVGAAEGTLRHLESGDVKSPNLLLGIRLADQLKVDPRYLALGEGTSISERFDAIERRLKKLEQRDAARVQTRR